MMKLGLANFKRSGSKRRFFYWKFKNFEIRVGMIWPVIGKVMGLKKADRILRNGAGNEIIRQLQIYCIAIACKKRKKI